MESIRYPYQKNKLALAVGVFLLFLFGSVPCGVLALLLSFLLNPSEAYAQLRSTPVWTLIGICGLSFLALLIPIWIIYASQVPREAILTPETFSYGRRGRLTTIRLAEIARITARRDWWDETLDWVITIETVRQQKLSLRQTLRYLGGFDYRAILRDLLPRLPATAQVDPKVYHFVETGRFSAAP